MYGAVLVAVCLVWFAVGGQSLVGAIDVGTIERPPFAFKDESGDWQGYTIELVEEIGERSNIGIDWQEQTVFADMLSATEQSELDIAAANISVTAERENTLDFSSPVYESGLQIFVPKTSRTASLAQILWQSGLLQFVGLAFAILLVVAHLMWWFELDHGGQDYFRDDYKGGIWDAFWWAFIIVTIGGFENERPERPIGRVLAVFWILASIFFISTFTAKITTSLTVAQLQSGIQTIDDLRGKNVGAPKGTTISAFLDKHAVAYTEYDDFSQVLDDVAAQTLDAGVGDAAVVRFHAANEGANDIALAGEVFAPDLLALAFPEDSKYQEVFNKGLARLREDGTLAQLEQKYFGE